MKLAEIYGPIFRLSLGGRSVLVLSSFELVNEVCDNERFDKFIGPGLMQARTIAGDGLFTAWTQEPNWKKAHNILTPSFGSMAIRSYLPEMVDIATQLVEKWSRLNPDEDIDVPGDMTRLTLDTIGLCAFSYRFNSFYSERPQPFVAAMQEALSFCDEQSEQIADPTPIDVSPHAAGAGGRVDDEWPHRPLDRRATGERRSRPIFRFTASDADWRRSPSRAKSSTWSMCAIRF